jgi:3-oxoacyl-[acyl-carrier protein] reductase
MTNKICIVTGATRGIGRAIAKMLLDEGAQVAICGREQHTVDKAVAELHAETGGKVAGKAADVRKHEDIAGLFQFVDTHFGGVDVLINNAGVGVFRSVSDFSVEDWQLP